MSVSLMSQNSQGPNSQGRNSQGQGRRGGSPTELTGAAREAWLKARKRRNWAIFFALVTFIVAVYFVAMVRMGGL